MDEAPAVPTTGKKGPDPLIGRTISDRYRVTSLIARGGMGKVYRAEQAPLGREVALKVLNPSYQGDHDPEFHKRFFLEASICAKLTHPNTVTIFDYGRTDDEIYYISMELLEGRTLHRALRDDGAMEPGRALHIARQICRSLREAHGQGVIHRDLKPANVFLMHHGDEDDFVKVLDFGLVKDLGDTGEDLTQTGLFMGSPKYMSPEQIRGEHVDGRTDVYALGVMLFEMLTGKVPFDKANSVNILMAHVHEEVRAMSDVAPDISVPVAVEQAVLKAMSKSADDRYESMDAMLAALKEATKADGLSMLSGELSGVHPGLQSGEESISGLFGPVDDALVTSSEIDGGAAWESPIAPPKGEKSRAPWLAVAVILLLALGAGGFVALTDGGRDAEATAAAETPAPTPTAPEAPPEPPPEPPPAADVDEPEAPAPIASVILDLRSTPAGALVTMDGRTLGTTPASVQLTGEDAERGRSLTLQFILAGYATAEVTRTVSSETLEISATLPRNRRAPRRPTRPRGDSMSESTMVPTQVRPGYKASPF